MASPLLWGRLYSPSKQENCTAHGLKFLKVVFAAPLLCPDPEPSPSSPPLSQVSAVCALADHASCPVPPRPPRPFLRCSLYVLSQITHQCWFIWLLLCCSFSFSLLTLKTSPCYFMSIYFIASDHSWLQFSRSKWAVSDSLVPHDSQHARPLCPSPTLGVYSDSCPWSRWCHPATSSSVVPFSSCPQSLPASGSFPMSQLFAWGGKTIGVSASASVLPLNTLMTYIYHILFLFSLHGGHPD